MRRVALLCVLIVAACERHAEILAPEAGASVGLPDVGCWTMRVEGDEPRTAGIQMGGRGTPQGIRAPLSVWSNPGATHDQSLQGTWRYGYQNTDSLYIGLGNSSTTRYALWLGRQRPSTADSVVWTGGARVTLADGHAWTTTATLARATCVDGLR